MNYKLIITLVLAFVAFVFIFQNAAPVQVRFLFWSLEMSRVLLMFILLGIGMAIGMLLGSLLRFRKRDKPNP